MRIGLTGTGGTGKTTVAKLLEGQRAGTRHPGVTRSLLEEWGQTEQTAAELPLELRWKFQKTVFDRKIDQDLKNADGIFDRTLLDHLAYCLLRCSTLIDDSVCRTMVILTQENLAKYDLLFYFPLYPWFVRGDGVRDDRLASRIAVDLLIQGLLREIGIEPITVPNIEPAYRVDFIIKHIELKRMVGGTPATAEGVIPTREERGVDVPA